MELEKLRSHRELILSNAKQHKIRTVKVFGSTVRNEATQESDLDLLVEFEKNANLFDLIRFKQSIEDLLQINVDVVTEESVHQSFKEEILKRSEEHTSELQSRGHLVCRLLLEKKKTNLPKVRTLRARLKTASQQRQ